LSSRNMRTAGTLTTLLLAVAVTESCASPGGQGVAPSEARSGAPRPAAAPTRDGSAPSVATIFSAAQAARGRSTFRAVCAECHYSSEFRGAHFQFSWRRRTVADFFEEISSTMPEDAPGSLEPGEYLAVVAYVLQLNGFPAGASELPLDLAVLDTHSMAAPAVGAAVGR